MNLVDLTASSEHSEPVDRENPWPGLATFSEAQRAFFFGRDDEARELVRRVERKTLTILFGQSGLGKSSLLQAGVFPRLRDADYVPVYVRLDHGAGAPALNEQIKRLVIEETSLRGAWSRPGAAAAGESLWEFLHHRDDVLRNGAGRQLTPVLVFDQFEEIFTLGSTDDETQKAAREFIAELSDLVENRAPASLEARLDAGGVSPDAYDFSRSDYRVLITLREDYLPHLESLRPAMPSLMQNRMRLTRLSGPQAIEAVVKPAPGLVPDEVARAIVAFVSGRSDAEQAEVEPSLLSLVCRELNHRRHTSGATQIDAALLAGSRETILAEFYERTLADQLPAVRHWIEDDLLTDSGYRENVALERARKTLIAAGADTAALDTLVSRRLLRIEERLDVRRIELTHDVLCAVVRSSRDHRRVREAQENEERRRREAENALLAARASERSAHRSVVRARLVATGSIALAVLAIAAAYWGYRNQQRARVAEQAALRTRELAETARVQAESLVSYLIEDVAPLLEQYGRASQLKQLADRAVGYFAALPPELRDLDTDRREAWASYLMAGVQDTLGAVTTVGASLDRADALYQRVLAAAPDDYVSRVRSIDLNTWRIDLGGQADLKQRKARWNQVVQELTQIVQQHPENIEVLRRLAQSRLRYANFLSRETDDFAQALAEGKALQALWQEIITRQPDEKFNRLWYATTLSVQSGAYTQLNDLESSIEKAQEQVDYIDESLQQDPGNLSLLQRAQSSAQGLAYAHGENRLVEMQKAELSARRYAQILVQIDPANLIYRVNLASAHRMEGYFLRADAQWSTARELSSTYRNLLTAIPNDFYYSTEAAYQFRNLPIAEAFLNEGHAAAAMGDLGAASVLLEQARQKFMQAHPDKSVDDPVFRKDYVAWMLWEGELVARMGDWPALQNQSQQLLESIARGLAAEPDSAEFRLRRATAGSHLGRAQLRQGKIPQATATLRQAVEDFQQTSELPARVDYHRARDTLDTREWLAEALLANGEATDARMILEATLLEREKLSRQQSQIWLHELALARTSTLLAETLDETHAVEALRRSRLLAQAEGILTSPDAAARMLAEDRSLLTHVQALKAVGQ